MDARFFAVGSVAVCLAGTPLWACDVCASMQSVVFGPETSISSNLELAPTPGSQNLGSFNIVINPDAGLAANPAALAAFNRAAQQWEAFIADPITVNIDAGLNSLAPTILGSASSVFLGAGYTSIRNAMVADAADEANDAIVAFLPTVAQFSGTVPSGSSFTGNIIATKSNLKALGFANLDADFGSSDGTITFNSSFSFDYDNSDGVGAGLTDFETVAAHEIGHILGFVSTVDSVDAGDTTIDIMPLDLFRFADNTVNDPSDPASFTTASRNFVPGGVKIFDDTENEWLMSTGVGQGDGRQASHWKDNLSVGLMDPTLAAGELSPLTLADLRALDLIGYEIVPEPATLGLAGLVTVLVLRRRSRCLN